MYRAVPGFACNSRVEATAFFFSVILGLAAQVFCIPYLLIIGAGAVIELFARHQGYHAGKNN